jgi:hypothetical protein
METITKTLPEIVEELGIKSTIQWQDTPQNAPEWAQTANAYRITLRYQNRRMALNFYQGRGNKEDPTTADIVYCLASDLNLISSTPTLKEYGQEFGWDENTAKTFRAIKDQSKRYQKLIGDASTLELLAGVEY